MAEREVVALEVTYLREKVQQLREALRIEQESKGIDLGRWGRFSHEWNRELRAWRQDKADCVIRSSRHRKAHNVAVLLFPAWQEIHYPLTQPRGWGRMNLAIVETTTLEDIERTLQSFEEEGSAQGDQVLA